MGFPKIKRVNTVGIRFTKGERNDGHYLEIIEHILGIERNEIHGLAEMGPKKFMIKFKALFTYNRIVQEFVGKPITIDDSHEFEVDDISTYKNRVQVKKVPFEMEDATLKTLLERFGKVENINTPLKRFGDYTDMVSDERIVWMVVEFPIPSSLYIKDSETYLYFSYVQQTKTCHKCGSDEHMVDKCQIYKTTKPQERDNAVDLDPIEMLSPNRNRTLSESSNSSSDSDECEESKSGLSSDSDIENDSLKLSPSQTVRLNMPIDNQHENPVSRPECGHVSSAEINLFDHLISHTGETEDSTKIPQIPIPMARRNYPSSSQNENVLSIDKNINKRELSVSPENSYAYHAKPKTVKVPRVECLV